MVRVLLAFLVVLPWSLPTVGAAQGRAQVVVLVRHAEKAEAPPDDVALNAEGAERARALAAVLADARVDTIITTEFRRTRDTAAPLAAQLKLTPRVVPAGDDTAAHVRAVADAVRAAGGTAVLVVGHSNTVPAVIAALGGPGLADLCETEYAHLFVLHLAPGEPARLIRGAYGVPDEPAGAGCQPMRLPE